MERSSRNLLVGLGAAVVVGSVVLSISNKAMAKIEVSANRQKAKNFVKDRLKGNKKALDVVEKLSDEQITNLSKVVDKVSDLKGRVGPHTSHLKKVTNKFKDKVKGKKR
ncbi:hypothetical protein SAMN04488700_0585 [Carnobacterium iners]|uniref:Uncharacterized protein n=2 Tax=Carnobacterium iners TaxID=1073423 RepID=A0A1X7MRM7_9LACT|nr:hypothetical protein [Carnobacterium iners]SEL30364.1 hypothetical protein SAMN04488114_1491 [Carnobacterium iners]SMH26978.1 hypothetical protein SAMN04488700_0365 [Carnobacterium iners]SMH27284.1 hypothetical protein SAMN04488700_0585 [Carnobacterium iners]